MTVYTATLARRLLPWLLAHFAGLPAPTPDTADTAPALAANDPGRVVAGDDVVTTDFRDDPSVDCDELPSVASGDSAPGCEGVRRVWVDYDALGIDGRQGGEWITYDYDEVVRPVTVKQLDTEGDVSVAVRLLVSEIGADRILMNRYGVLEGIGILQTVDNRLDREVYDVQDEAEAPSFPGCGAADGTFARCANAPGQYLGMVTWRALDPQSHYPAELLEPAVDRAVLAFFLQRNHLVDDFTGGATNYVHRCGGAAYGMTTNHCDAHIGNSRRDDVPGANPFTGPIVFKAPEAWHTRSGVYSIAESRRVDYDPWYDVSWGLDDDDALADAGDDDALDLSAYGVKFTLRPEAMHDEALAAPLPLADLAESLGAPDPAALERVYRPRR